MGEDGRFILIGPARQKAANSFWRLLLGAGREIGYCYVEVFEKGENV